MIDEATVNELVGAKIRARREKLGLTSTELAARSDGDFSQSSIVMYERGARALTPAKLIRLAELLGCSPKTLLP